MSDSSLIIETKNENFDLKSCKKQFRSATGRRPIYPSGKNFEINDINFWKNLKYEVNKRT